MNDTLYVRCGFLASLAVLLFVIPAFADAADKTQVIEIANVSHDGAVDFQKEILPILRANCLACHNATDAESELVLETPQSILKGGSIGPSAIAGKGAESLLVLSASHAEEPAMPPAANKVGAKNLTPQQLGLLKLWIDQGAKGEVTTGTGPIAWQPLPEKIQPVYAIAVSPQGEYVAAGRANQVFIYSIPAKRLVTRLTDPELQKQGVYNRPGVAHLDLVQSLAFSPDGKWLASGGYRTAKLWQVPENPQRGKLNGLEGEAKSLAVSPDGKLALVGEANGKAKLFDLATSNIVRTFDGHGGAVAGVAFSTDGARAVTGSQDKFIRIWNVADGKQLGKIETAGPVNAVAFVLENKQVVSGGGDNNLRVWALNEDGAPTLPEVKEGEPSVPKPLKELGGHGGLVTCLKTNNSGTQFFSGSQDGTLRLWDAANGNQIRQFNYGGPVTAFAISPDEKRIAAASSNNTAKIFQTDNGQQLAELRGDHRARQQIEIFNQSLALARRHVENAKQDLTDAQNRKKSEEENAKKAEETRKNSMTELAKKEEEYKKPAADKMAADEAFATAEPDFKNAEEEKGKLEAEAKVAEDARKAADEQRNAAAKAATEANTTAQQAAQKFQQIQNAASSKPDDAALAEELKNTEKAKADADAVAKQATDAKAAADKVFEEADAKNKLAQDARNKANQAFNEKQNKFREAENKVKQTAAPFQKATDELNAAKRAAEAAERSVARSGEAVKLAAEKLPGVEAALKQREEQQAALQQQLDAAQKVPATTEKPILAVAFVSDGSEVATAGEDQLVHRWSAENGQPIDLYTGQGASITALANLPDGGLLALGNNGSGIIWNPAADWPLARTIGTPDSPGQLVDRVTALHFSPDSQILATGSGEPSRSGELKLWKVADGSLVREIKDAHSDTIFDLEFSPDGQHIASGAADRFLKVHEVATGKFVRAFEGHTHHVMGVSWRADGRLLASCGADKAVKIWDFTSGDQKKTIAEWKKEVTAIKFIAASDELITSAGDPQVTMRDANGGNRGGFGGVAEFTYIVRPSAAGKIIAAGSEDGFVRVWNEQKQPIANFAAPAAEAAAAKQAAN